MHRPSPSGTAPIPGLLTREDFGCADYQSVWALQKNRVDQRLAGEIGDTLLLGEHEPVITLGRKSHADNLLHPSVPVIAIERGGDVTYHGPGQLVAYPILKLEGAHRDLHGYLRKLEQVLVLTLGEFGLEGLVRPGYTGLWARHPHHGTALKIASIGVAVKSWVTYHGVALNVSTDLNAFTQINPCGMDSAVMTSLEALLQQPVPMVQAKQAFTESFQSVFGFG